MLYEQFYDEINAELQQMAAIEADTTEKRIYIGSGEDAYNRWIQEAANNSGVIICG